MQQKDGVKNYDDYLSRILYYRHGTDAYSKKTSVPDNSTV